MLLLYLRRREARRCRKAGPLARGVSVPQSRLKLTVTPGCVRPDSRNIAMPIAESASVASIPRWAMPRLFRCSFDPHPTKAALPVETSHCFEYRVGRSQCRITQAVLWPESAGPTRLRFVAPVGAHAGSVHQPLSSFFWDCLSFCCFIFSLTMHRFQLEAAAQMPSITGFEASGPMLPRPSTAVPFVTTPTRLLRAVKRAAFSEFST
jgi:hypothetical protein